MTTTLFTAFAQAESESISGNMRWSVQKRMEAGTFNTCLAPLGFDLLEGKLVVNPEEAVVVQLIFSEYLRGKTSREIAQTLNAEGTLNRFWRREMVDYILTNERYAGNALLQKKYRTEAFPREVKRNRGERSMYFILGSNEPIVSQETFDRAKALRQGEKKGAGTCCNTKEHCKAIAMWSLWWYMATQASQWYLVLGLQKARGNE